MKLYGINVKQVYQPLDKICLDEELAALVRKANPVASTKTASMLFEGGEDNLDLLAYQSPLLGYIYQRQYYLLSGFFTHTKLLSFAVKRGEESVRRYPITLLEKQPERKVRRRIILHALTQSLLNEGFVTSATAIGEFLNIWFEKDPQARSIYQSAEWRDIYPKLTTKEKVSEWLHISKKQL
uniref:hypothetical protein n=1 Tax=Thaumasiovibrio occultus TaxID=1891184 RepID=UPI000B3570E9|nr:hypothetical protein [Thaumasiovibrio occultus]